jgi:hypothetical protein
MRVRVRRCSPILLAGSFVVLALLLLPSATYAQAAITGVVKDTSGAVLPGVGVEARSDALIEKVRAVVTDGTGQYRIVDLRPGVYAVTFMLPGFKTVTRSGIELSGTFVATVDAQLEVGSVQETVTVTGGGPVVDVQSVKEQQIVSRAVFAEIPSSRTAAGIQALIPGLVPSVNSSPDLGGITASSSGGTMAIHGSRPIDSRSLNDGLTTNHAGGGGGGGNNANAVGAQEIVVTTSGGLGEAETGGVTVNLVPRDGGNNFSGTIFAAGTRGALQGDNYTQNLKDQGLKGASRILYVYDINPMFGGRIIRDKLWFFVTERDWGAENTVPGLFVNKNAGNPNAWTYDPDFSKEAFNDTRNATHVVRLSWQATAKNKISGYWSNQPSHLNDKGGGSLTTSASAGGGLTGSNQTIEATTNNDFTPSNVHQITWSSPLTNRLLLEAGYGDFLADYGNRGGRTDGTFSPAMIRVVEQSGFIPGLAYRAPVVYQISTIATRTWRASASYVTGAHNLKVGYFGGYTNPTSGQYWYNQATAYRFNNGVPNQLTETATGIGEDHVINYTRNLIPTSLYAQDQWTTGRLTLQGGVRYDYMRTSFPLQRAGGDTPLLPTPIEFPAGSTAGVNWSDITPRIGAAYDLFGNGRTAIKFHIAKYMESYLVGSSSDNDLNPLQRLALSTTRSWTDANHDFVPDCDLNNRALNGECGAMTNQNLGTATINRDWDPNYISGWGARPYNWATDISVQQALASRVSLTVGYFRRWFGNWYATQNLATTVADYTPFSILAPSDPRLPDGGGYVIDGLYNLVPGKVGQVHEYSQASSNIAPQTENWHGVDAIVNARLGPGFTAQGGLSTGRRLADNCALRAANPYLGSNGTFSVQNDTRPPTTINDATLTNPYCRLEEPFLTQVRGLATYTIPKVDVQAALTWQSNPGPELGANFVVSNAIVRQTLGRDLSGNAANITVPLIPPATYYGNRVNEFDLRLAKIVRMGRVRARINVDIYNLTNTDTPLSYSNTFIPGGVWLTPTSLLPARFLKLGGEIDF